MNFQGVIFDLDGTLLDTLTDIAHAANSVLKKMNYPTYPVEDYRHFVGNGVIALFERTLPGDAVKADILNTCRDGFFEAYEQEWNVHAAPYPGIPELLNALTEMNLKMGVLSNKPHAFTKLCVDALLSDWHFDPVFGERADVPIKPDPQGAHEIAAYWELSCEQCLYVGDTRVDMQTARSANMYAVGVEWGFRDWAELVATGAKHVLTHPAELLQLLVTS